MRIDDFCAEPAVLFSNGMDLEYTVIGRVARRIWARAARALRRQRAQPDDEVPHPDVRPRSLHAQEIQFNDIRNSRCRRCTRCSINCNSLHTNAYKRRITPTEVKVWCRAVAIQMIINKELGLNFNVENPWQ